MASIAGQHKRPANTAPFVISGPSGAGKSTIIQRLQAEYPGVFGLSISHTTRSPRGQEKNGVEYHFVTKEQFEQLIRENGFIEHAQFSGNYYGTSFQAVKDVQAGGQICVLDIEMEGVKQIMKENTLGARVLYLQPPDLETLEARLRGRGTEKEEDKIQKRLMHARMEMEFAKSGAIPGRIVVNVDLDTAYGEVKDFIFS